MDPVGAQTSPPVGSSPLSGRPGATRLSSLFNPLRKTGSVRELHHLSQEQYTPEAVLGSPAHETASSPVAHPSPGDISTSPRLAPAPPPIMQSGMRRTREHRDEKGATRTAHTPDDDDYVPYHGPISPPPVADKHPMSASSGEWQRHSIVPGASLTAHNLVGLGLSDAGGAPSRLAERAAYLAGPLRGDATAQSPSVGSPTVAPSAASEARRPAVMHSGLPTAYTHGGNAPSDWVYAPRSGALPDTLPSLMRFDKDREAATLPKLGAFRREPFHGSPTFTQQQHQHRAAAPVAGTVFSMRPAQGSQGSWAPSTGLNSASSSPMTGPTSLPHRPPTSESSGQRSIHRKDGSATSSEDHGSRHDSTITFAHVGTHGSASTSATSLREMPVNKGARTAMTDMRRSGSGPPSIRQSSQHASLRQHQQSVSRSTLASATNSDRDKGKAPMHQVHDTPTHRTARGASETQSIASSAGTSPAASNLTASLPIERRSTKDSYATTDDADHAFAEGALYGSQDIVNRHLVSTLSPIAGSSPGASQFSPSEKLDAASPDAAESAAQRGTGASYDPYDAAHQQQQRQYADAHQNDTERSTEEARRRYLLLQQLHLDELADHAPENSGWLEPKNGCERVLMPRPMLRERDSIGEEHYDKHGNETERRSRRAHSIAAFERNRQVPISYISEPGDPSRAQALLSSSPQPSTRIDSSRPFFHHRMPPALPPGDGWHRVDIDERPEIPKRTSSRTGHRRRSRSHAGHAAEQRISTPALTPNVLSDAEDDTDEAATPDIVTVLAEGRALDEERERWRKEHRKSLASTGSGHRHSRPRAKVTPSNTRPAAQKRSVRQVRSSPNLHQSQRSSEPMPPLPPMPSPPVPKSCLPSARPRDDEGQRRATRMRSKSLEGLSRLRAGARIAASFAAPCMVSTPDQHSRHEYHEKGRHPESGSSLHQSSTSKRRRRSRAVTMSKFDDEKHARPAHSESRIVIEQPFIIGRNLSDENTSPGLGEGPYVVRHPSWQVSNNEENVMPVNLFGAAISSPRPDIGHGPERPAFTTAGRYATQRGYHRPQSSDELADLLGRSAGRKGTLNPQHRKPVRSSENATDDGGDRRISLGMSQLGQETERGLHAEPEAERWAPKAAASLPVPPRRPRSAGTGGGSSRSPLAESDSDTRTISTRGEPNLPGDRQDHGLNTVHKPAGETGTVSAPPPRGMRMPLNDLESYAHPGAFQTPPLTQPMREGEWFTKASDSGAVGSSYAVAGGRLRSTVKAPGESASAATSNRLKLESQRLQRSTSSLGRPSSDDSISQHSRELWNTDEHGEEAFSSLFFRRPRPTGEIMIRDLSGIESSGTRQSSETGQREVQSGMFDDLANEGGEEAAIGDVERLMGGLLDLSRLDSATAKPTSSASNSISGSRQQESMVDNASAWNESSIGEHLSPLKRSLSVKHTLSDDPSGSRASTLDQITNLRLGRVDKRQPQIQTSESHRMSSSTREGGDDSAIDDSSSGKLTHEIMPREGHFSRPRLDSFAASVQFAPGEEEGGSDDAASHRSYASQRNIGDVRGDRTPRADLGPAGFINFASPSAPPPLSLPEDVARADRPAETTANISTHLEPPSAWRGSRLRRGSTSRSSSGSSTSSTPHQTIQTSARRGSEGIFGMVRSRVWPTPPASPGPNQLGGQLEGERSNKHSS